MFFDFTVEEMEMIFLVEKSRMIFEIVLVIRQWTATLSAAMHLVCYTNALCSSALFEIETASCCQICQDFFMHNN